ncbi:MAG: hypothetical protein MUC97_17735 [Bernardetiaceae bacterium]|jgi:hypothetical protein|nr:hypothetical protein [Bernardetiaceae bacterium]
MTAPEVIRISKKEARLLIKELEGVLDKHLYEDQFFEAYVLADDRLVPLSESHAVVYPSKRSFLTFLAAARERANFTNKADSLTLPRGSSLPAATNTRHTPCKAF